MDSEKCTDCAYEFPVYMHNEPERTPCPECGATSRSISVSITEGIKLYDGLGFKVKDPSRKGKSKIKAEGFHKYVGSQKAKLVKHVRVIDRENDRYKELVLDAETGEIIHNCEEPLSEHIGHGKAKKHKQIEGEKRPFSAT